MSCLLVSSLVVTAYTIASTDIFRDSTMYLCQPEYRYILCVFAACVHLRAFSPVCVLLCSFSKQVDLLQCTIDLGISSIARCMQSLFSLMCRRSLSFSLAPHIFTQLETPFLPPSPSVCVPSCICPLHTLTHLLVHRIPTIHHMSAFPLTPVLACLDISANIDQSDHHFIQAHSYPYDPMCPASMSSVCVHPTLLLMKPAG